MKIVQITDTNMAYVPARFTHLINKYTAHRCYLLQAKHFIFGNPLNIVTPRKVDEIVNILDQADVLHFHGNTVFDRRKFLGIKINNYYQKSYCLHYHGTPQRERYTRYIRRVPMLVSTPEMLPLFPGSKYFPNLIDEKLPIYQLRPLLFGTQRKPSICHHFSFHQRFKNTNWFERAKNNIENNGNCLNFAFLPRMNLIEALQERTKHDIIYDHLQGYYGQISIEGMAQGLCVVNGSDDHTKRNLESFFGKQPPFLTVTKQNFIATLKNITREEIDDYGELGRKFMEKEWSGEKNIHRLIDYYRSL